MIKCWYQGCFKSFSLKKQVSYHKFKVKSGLINKGIKGFNQAQQVIIKISWRVESENNLARWFFFNHVKWWTGKTNKNKELRAITIWIPNLKEKIRQTPHTHTIRRVEEISFSTVTAFEVVSILNSWVSILSSWVSQIHNSKDIHSGDDS